MDRFISPGRITIIKLLKVTALAGILTLALWAPAAQAYYMELTGNRTSTDTSQLITTGAFSARKGFEIAWHITAAAPGAAFHYEYTISGVDGGALGKALSHWILEVSNPSSPSDFSNISGLQEPCHGQYVPATWQPQPGKPGLPGDMYGIRFDVERNIGKADDRIYTFAFDSFFEPVWGDFYAQGSNGVYAYNTGFGTDPDQFTTDFSPWILVPGARTVAPLPSSLLLLGSGLAGLGMVRFRLQQKKV
jgi:hypothetical protein